MRAALAGKSSAAIFFELPNASFIFQNKGIWDIIYEHCFYYSSGALARLFSACGYDVLKVSETFNGQYLCLEARVSSRDTGLLGDAGGDLKRCGKTSGGSRRVSLLPNALGRYARSFCETRQAHGAMGSWGQGGDVLERFSRCQSLEYIVDVNPHKWGLYIPGTGQKVVSPEILKEYRPDVLVIVNPNYRDEISRQVAALGIAQT